MDWSNPLPISLGGGPTDIESTWRSLRAMEGGEHGPGPEEGIEDLWRQQEATALVAAERAIERAFLQVFPALSTDALSIWESILLTPGAADDVQLRELLAIAWLPATGSTTPSLTDELTAISSQLSIELEDEDVTQVTIQGKAFGYDADLTSPVGLSSAVYPNFASVDVLRVVYTLTPEEIATPTGAVDTAMERATTLLNRRLPSWQTWTFATIAADASFLLDGGNDGQSVLDLTPLG